MSQVHGIHPTFNEQVDMQNIVTSSELHFLFNALDTVSISDFRTNVQMIADMQQIGFLFPPSRGN